MFKFLSKSYETIIQFAICGHTVSLKSFFDKIFPPAKSLPPFEPEVTECFFPIRPRDRLKDFSLGAFVKFVDEDGDMRYGHVVGRSIMYDWQCSFAIKLLNSTYKSENDEWEYVTVVGFRLSRVSPLEELVMLTGDVE